MVMGTVRSLQSSRHRERLEKEKRGRGKWPNSPAVRVATPHYIREKSSCCLPLPFPCLSHCHPLLASIKLTTWSKPPFDRNYHED